MDFTTLSPPPYLSNIVGYLKDNESELWQWFEQHQLDPERMNSARLQLLKTTYRIEKDVHPRLYQLAAGIAAKFEIDQPLTFYQAQESNQLNAALSFIPGEAHVIFFGPLLDNFTDAELEVIVGHELCHFLMWTQNQQDFFIAEQVLNALANDPQAEICHSESARLFSLFTEVYCDRGALKVTQDLYTTISTLLRVGTGLKEINAQSFLKQSEEILQQENKGSDSLSHPESYLRARALQLWHEHPEDVEGSIEILIRGPHSLQKLDLLGRQYLENLTREFLQCFLLPQWFRTDTVLTHARLFFDPLFLDDPQATTKTISETDLCQRLQSADEKQQEYYCYLMLDFVAADRELEELPLAQAIQWSQKIGVDKRFAELAQKELKLTKSRFAAIRKQTAQLLDAAAADKECHK